MPDPVGEERRDAVFSAIAKLRGRFRRHRYRMNKIIKACRKRGSFVPDDYHREVQTWLAAEEELDRLEREITDA